MSSHPKTHIFSFNLSLNAPWFEKLAFEKNTMYFTLVILQSSTTQRPYFFVNFWLSPNDPTYFCIFLSLNAKNHALTQSPLIFWACALTECPSLLEGGPYTRIHFIFDCPPPALTSCHRSNYDELLPVVCLRLYTEVCEKWPHDT